MKKKVLTISEKYDILVSGKRTNKMTKTMQTILEDLKRAHGHGNNSVLISGKRAIQASKKLQELGLIKFRQEDHGGYTWCFASLVGYVENTSWNYYQRKEEATK